MLRRMETGEAFSLTYVTYNRKKGAGGKVVQLGECVLLQADKEARAAVGRQLTPVELRGAEVREEGAARRKDPHHKAWYTRNVRVLQNGVPTTMTRKIHPPLVLEYNHLRVLP